MDYNYRSEDINQIMKALALAQGAYKPLSSNEPCPGGKFANLQAILGAVREALSTNGLSFYQYIQLLDDGAGASLLVSMLGHESGQYISSCARVISGKNERQTGNIYETYKRLHALMLLGIAPSENDPFAFDDNGTELADFKMMEELKKPYKPKPATSETITTDQYNELLIELERYPTIAENMMEVYKISTLADLPREEFHKARAKIFKIKRINEDYENNKNR